MIQLLRLRAVIEISIKRLLAQPMLTAATTIGMTVAVALMLTVPIYAESVSFRVLKDRLAARGNQGSRPPFSFMYNFIGAWADPVNLEAVEPLDHYLRRQAGDVLGLPVTLFVRHLETPNFRLYPTSTTNYEDEDARLALASLGATEHIEDYIELIEGHYPAPADPAPDSMIEVMVTETFANETGVQVGEEYLGYNWRMDPTNSQQIIRYRISGIWRAIDEQNPYWFYLPRAFDDQLLASFETFAERISPYREDEVHLGVWYLVTDGSGISTSRVDAMLEADKIIESEVDKLLPGTYVQLTPADQLAHYKRIVDVLTLILTVFSVPIITLMVVFIVMVIGLSVEQRRNETAVLRSRGTTPFQVIGLAVVDGVVMGLVALVIGTGLAVIFTSLMGTVRSFMDFSSPAGFQVSIPPSATTTAGLALLFSVIIHVIPTISASRHTIISYKQERARVVRRPIWHRYALDLLLVIVTAYFYFQMVQQGNLFLDQSGAAVLEDAYDNPFMFLLPPVTIFALALLTLRLLPLVMRFIGWLLQISNSVGMLIVTRQLERTPGYHFLPSILLICTISLGIFTASFARTIDRYLYEQQYYRYASDMAVLIVGPPSPALYGSGAAAEEEPTTYMHISEFNTISHIEGATRLGEYAATAHTSSGNVNGKFMGLDRAEFPFISFWRPDFASQRLGLLTNNLALQPDSVLISREFAESRAFDVGDLLRVDVKSVGEIIPLSLEIVGIIDYFPRWYPENDGPLFVGNLDYLFQQAGTELRHVILTRNAPAFDEETFLAELRERGAAFATIHEPMPVIERVQAQPERQGLFGLLSVGFLASSLVTVLGFFLYTLFSYHRRYVELGILRAVGLSRASMMLSVAWELTLLTLVGVSLGIGLGLLVSVMYIPYLQLGTNPIDLVPPYVVMLALPEVVQILLLFVTTFALILALLLYVFSRMRIFQAVKLGETV